MEDQIFLNKKKSREISFYFHLFKFWLDQVILLCSGFALRFMGSHRSWVAHSSPYGFKTLLMRCGDCWGVASHHLHISTRNPQRFAPSRKCPTLLFHPDLIFNVILVEKFRVRKNVVNFLSAFWLNWENCLTFSFLPQSHIKFLIKCF